MTQQMPPTLKSGVTGPDVERLQGGLSRLGYQVTPTGKFDESTEAAVKKFQQDHNLTVDGVVAHETGTQLDIVLSKP